MQTILTFLTDIGSKCSEVWPPFAAPPSVRLREEVKKVMAGPETNVSLLCLVDGLPKPNITWTM